MSSSIVDAVGPVPLSANLAATLARAAEYAGAQSHVEVTLEHLLLALTEDPDASLVLGISRVDVDALKTDVSKQLGLIEARTSEGHGAELRVSAELRQILEAANAAAQGRRRAIDGAIVLAAIVGEGKSAAAHLLHAQGLTFETAIRALQQAASATQPPPRHPDRPAGSAAAPTAPPRAEPAASPAAAPAPEPASREEPAVSEQMASREAPETVAPPSHGVALEPPAERSRPSAHHATTSAEDILASARQRVQGRIAPGLPELQPGTGPGKPKASATAGMGAGTFEPAPQAPAPVVSAAPPPATAAARPDALAAAEAAAEAEFASMSAEARDRAPRDAGEPVGDAGDTATASMPEAAGAPSAPAPTPAPPVGSDYRPAPVAQRPLPPGALRPGQTPPIGQPVPQQHGQGPAVPLPVPTPAQRPRADAPPPLPRGPAPAPARAPHVPPMPSHPATAGLGAGAPQPTRPPVFGNYPPPPASSPQGGEMHGAPPPVPAARASVGPPPQAMDHVARPAIPPAPPGAPTAAPGAAPMPPRGEPPYHQPQQHAPSPAAVAASPRAAMAQPPVAAAPATAPPGQAAAPGRSGTRAASVAIGQLVENIPRAMKVAIPSVVEVRIARADVKAVAESMQGGGAVHRHELVVTKAMSVKLRAPDGGFFIETSSPETQWIDRVHGLMSDDYASWRWTVTPKTRGRRRLQLVVSARTVGTDGLTAETQLPEQIIEVQVRTNYGAAMKRVAGWAVAAILGGALARFGEDLPQAVANLAQLIVK